MLVCRLLVSQSSTTMLVYRAEQVAFLKHFPRSPNIVRTPLTTWFKRAAVKRWTQIRSRHLILKWHVEKRWTKTKTFFSQGDARPESRGRVGYRDESECWQWQSEKLTLFPEPKLFNSTQKNMMLTQESEIVTTGCHGRQKIAKRAGLVVTKEVLPGAEERRGGKGHSLLQPFSFHVIVVTLILITQINIRIIFMWSKISRGYSWRFIPCEQNLVYKSVQSVCEILWTNVSQFGLPRATPVFLCPGHFSCCTNIGVHIGGGQPLFV